MRGLHPAARGMADMAQHDEESTDSGLLDCWTAGLLDCWTAGLHAADVLALTWVHGFLILPARPPLRVACSFRC
jgi:hypothetical protein